MRLINLYLLGYVLFAVGVLLALWRAGLLAALSSIWMAIGLAVAVGLAGMLAWAAGPAVTIHDRK